MSACSVELAYGNNIENLLAVLLVLPSNFFTFLLEYKPYQQ